MPAAVRLERYVVPREAESLIICVDSARCGDLSRMEPSMPLDSPLHGVEWLESGPGDNHMGLYLGQRAHQGQKAQMLKFLKHAKVLRLASADNSMRHRGEKEYTICQRQA